MHATITPVGPDVGAVVARQVKQLTAVNRKVGAAVNRAGVAALRRAIPYKHFAGYPLRIKGKVTSAGGDHVEVRFQGSPVGFFVILDTGAKPHQIRARKKKALSWGAGDDQAARSVQHPGVAGRHVWSNAEPALTAAVADVVTDAYTAVFSRG